MSTLRLGATMFLAWLVAHSMGALAQDYPTKPIRIMASEPGGGGDFMARLIAVPLAGPLGQQVIVDNRSTTNSPEIAARAQPDGYTFLVTGANLWITPLLQRASYDALKDFSPITIMASSPQILVVHPSLAAKSVQELIALAKAKPGQLNYSSGGTGGGGHLAAELFNHMAGVNIVRVSYKGGGPSVLGLVAGEVQLSFASANAGITQVKAGKLRALGVTSAKPTPLVPGVPSVAESGLPGYEYVSPDVAAAPARTPTSIVARLNREIVRIVHTPDVKEKLANIGAEPSGSTPEQLGARMKSDIAIMGKLFKDTGIKAQ